MKTIYKLIALLFFITSCDVVSNPSDDENNIASFEDIYKLDDDKLSEWTDAYVKYESEDNAAFMLIKDNADSAMSVMCFASIIDAQLKDEMYFYLDSNYHVNAFNYNGIIYISLDSENDPDHRFHGYDANGKIVDEFIVEKKSSATTKGWNEAESIHDIFNIIQNTDNLNKGRYLDFGVSIGSDALIKMVKLGAKWNLIANLAIEAGLHGIKEYIKNAEYGNLVPSLSMPDANSAFVTLNGESSSGSLLYVGLLIGKNPDRLFYSNCELKVANIGEKVQFKIPDLSIGTYYIKPVLISDKICKEFQSGSIREWFVRYGNTEVLKIPEVRVLSHKEYYDDYYGQYHSSADKYLARVKLKTSIDNMDKAPIWGIRIYKRDKNGDYIQLDDLSEALIDSEYTFTYEDTFCKDDFINDYDEDEYSITLYASPYATNGTERVFGDTYEFTISMRWVDLGLPSGILWAKYNVGATSPEEYGGYYAWGETEEKDIYTFDTYKYLQFYGYDPISGDPVYEYAYLGNNISGTEYDAANMLWNDGARLPTKNEIQELINHCVCKGANYNGVNGNKLIGPNGNEIFIPLAGHKTDNELDNYNPQHGVYWTGSYDTENNIYTLDMEYGHIYMLFDNWSHKFGITIRPVKDKEEEAE